MWGWRVMGGLFILGGAINLMGLGEDIPASFMQMAAANAGTRLAPVSDFVAANAGFATGIAGAFMVGTGLAEWGSGGLARLGGFGQLAMMVVFVALLHRAFPEIVLADGLLALGVLALLGAGARGAAA